MAITPTTRTHDALSRVEANLVAVGRAEFERLQLARAWALAHLVTDPDQLSDPRRRPTPLGACALPVDEYAAAEFAAALELHPLAGRRWMADGVDLHDRLPRFWAALEAGQVEVWVGRKVAAATTDLSDEQARWVDVSIADVARSLPPGRLLTLVAARVVEADQASAERKAEEAAAAQTVWMSRRYDHGTRTLVVRGESNGVRRFHGTVDHLAHLLRNPGTAEQRAASIDEPRADAVGLSANPLAALKLMVGAGEHDCAEASGSRGRARSAPRRSSTCT